MGESSCIESTSAFNPLGRIVIRGCDRGIARHAHAHGSDLTAVLPHFAPWSTGRGSGLRGDDSYPELSYAWRIHAISSLSTSAALVRWIVY